MIEYIVNKKVDINAANADGWCPIHYVCYNGTSTILSHLIKNGAKTTLQINSYHGMPCKYTIKDILIKRFSGNTNPFCGISQFESVIPNYINL